MNIVYIGTAYPMRGGIAHFNAILARELAQRHTVRFLSFTRQYPGLLFPGKTQYVADAEAAASVRMEAEPVLDSIAPWSWWRTARWALEADPDLLLFKYWMPFFAPAFGTIARLVRRRRPVRVVFVCDNIIPHERSPIDLPLTRYALRAVDGFVVMSASVRDDLLALRPQAPWKLVPHPIYNIFGERIPKAEARRRLGLEPGPLLLFFGYVRAYKGLDLLLRALPRIRARVPARLLVAGEFYEGEARYRRLAGELGITDAVHFCSDYIPEQDVAAYFSAADVTVLPYRSATQSGIVQVAYQLDTPVICTDVGGLAEVVPDGSSGFVVPPDDIEALADAVIRYYAENWEERLRAGVRVEKRRYGWDPLVRAIEELAGAVSSGGASGRPGQSGGSGSRIPRAGAAETARTEERR
ncbi:MAG: glycosyltransferase [Candidatus Eisenbacteria sp.]|nr:glycosyltransferase [Candidatus Eisenbacteria bacterium]